MIGLISIKFLSVSAATLSPRSCYCSWICDGLWLIEKRRAMLCATKGFMRDINYFPFGSSLFVIQQVCDTTFNSKVYEETIKAFMSFLNFLIIQLCFKERRSGVLSTGLVSSYISIVKILLWMMSSMKTEVSIFNENW